MSRFRNGLLLGFAAGYVLGAKAGRERYQQIVESWERVTATEPAKWAVERGRQVAGRSREMAGERMATASAKLRDAMGGHEG